MTVAKILMLAPLFIGGTAVAQEVPPAAPTEETATQAAPAPPAPASPAQISDEEVARFALAALVVEQIADDATIDQDQKQAAMLEVVRQTGLEPQRFNEIATASQSDEELQERIQVAVTQHVENAQRNQ